MKVEREVILKRHGERSCGSCENSTKTDAYCQECTKHKQLKSMHSVVSFARPFNPVNSKPQLSVSCSIHPTKCFDYYCMACSSLICADCMVDPQHAQHSTRCIDINEAAHSEIRQLKTLLPKMEDYVPQIKDAIKEISSIVKNVGDNQKKNKEKVDTVFEEIYAAIKTCHYQLSRDLDDVAIAKKTRLEMQKENLHKITASLQLALTTANEVCNEYTSIEVLSIKGAIQQVFEEINPVSLYPVCTDRPDMNIDVTSSEEVLASLNKIQLREDISFYPPLCSLIGVSSKVPIGIYADCGCLLTLQARNSRGEDLEEGGAIVKATVTENNISGNTFDCKVNDLHNGKYEILFTSGPSEGNLHISIDNTAVQDSPYSLKFIDYEKSMVTMHQVSTEPHAPEYIDFAAGTNQLYISTNQGHVQVLSFTSVDSLMGKANTAGEIKTIPRLKLGGIKELRGIAVDQTKGVVFIASSRANKVIKTDLDGNVLATTGKDLKFMYTTGLCLTKGGEILLAGDCARKRVHVLKSDFSFVRFIKCRAQVWGVTVDLGGNIHVGTIDCVEVFDIEGGKITEYGQEYLYKAGDIQFPNFQQPSDCKFSFVTECVDKGQIFFFNWKTDTVLHRINIGRHPLGLRIDQSGCLRVCCFEDKKIQILLW